MKVTRREALALTAAMMTGGMAMAESDLMGMAAPPSPGRICQETAACREKLYGLLGDLPPRNRPISVTKRAEEERDGYILETLDLDLNGFESVPAYFARPKQLSGRVPAMLYNHAHGGDYKLGKTEFIEGRKALQQPPYAKVITDLGWAGLCIDTWAFGERNHISELDCFKVMLWRGQVMWGMMVYDNLRALDYLISRPEVDAARISTLGISMGSTMAWWCAALDERIKVTVDICCLTEYHTLIQKEGLGGHGIYYYVPGLIKDFTTADINTLIAPRAHLSLAGLQDKLTPPEGLAIVDRELKQVYANAGAPENWRLITYDDGHRETEEGRKEILTFLQEHM